ncbi:MAG: cysteine-rich KTR domain-containing protein [Bacteroidales bacterium]|nr:cysteine-rich KTR domain-containing protein [Clostridium sp.]MCM1204741.1 cysteine-rich KTR domain-containing protein [Bacteroidales bacterium]
MGIKWYRCPICTRKLLKYRDDTILKNFPAYCKQCRNEILVTIEPVSQIVIR